MSDDILFRLLNKETFKLKLNQFLPSFSVINELFKHYNVPFETWLPSRTKKDNTTEMTFAVDCSFIDVYIIAYLLRAFGIKTIYPSRRKDGEIAIGTYLYNTSNIAEFAIAEPIAIESLLEINPNTSMEDVINIHFKNLLLTYEAAVYDEVIDDGFVDDYDYDDNDYDHGYNSNNWLKDAAGTDDPETMNDVYWNLD